MHLEAAHDETARVVLTTPGGWLLVVAVLAPFVGVLAGLALGGRSAQRVANAAAAGRPGRRGGIAWTLVQSGDTVVYLLGGWAPPLGIALRADGLSAAMLLAVAVVICGIGVYARADFGTPAGAPEQRAPFAFWLLLLAVWGSLNLVFVSGDLFTLYVALELLTFAGVPLVCLDGRGETLRAALRYLLFALVGSLLYLLGAVLLYGGYGTLDIALLAGRIQPEPIALGRRRADDGRPARQDRAVPAAPLAAAGACRRAGRRERGAVGAGDQGLVVPGRAAVVRRHARRGDVACRATAGRDWARRPSWSAASSRCGRSG